MSFLKYQDRPDVICGNGRGPLSFSRGQLDGAPFRGRVPLLKEQEWEALPETVYDAYPDIFDLSQPEQKKRFQEIIDRTANGWYKIYAHMPHWCKNERGEDVMKVYLVWSEPHRELNPKKVPPGAWSDSRQFQSQ